LAKVAQEVFKLDAQGVLVIGAPPFAAAGVAQLRKIGVTQSIFVLAIPLPGCWSRSPVIPHAVSALPRSIRIQWPDHEPDAGIPDGHEGRVSGVDRLRALPVGRLPVGAHRREGLRRSRDVTKPDALAKALRAMGELDFDGYRIDFSKVTLAAASSILL